MASSICAPSPPSAVVVFHAAERTGGHFAIAAGVNVFFVISGFITWVICERRPTTPARFLRERLERIAPVYWIATGIMVAGALASLFPNLKLTLGPVLGSLFFIPHHSPSNGQVWSVLVQGWTLNYEIFFYMVFAGSLRAHRLATILICLAWRPHDGGHFPLAGEATTRQAGDTRSVEAVGLRTRRPLMDREAIPDPTGWADVHMKRVHASKHRLGPV